MKKKIAKGTYKKKPLVDGNETAQQIKSSHFDPNGSWTGNPKAPLTKPEQDVDDL